MDTFHWDEDLTDLALKNQTRQSWATTNPADMLKALRMIADRAGGYPETAKEELRAAVGTRARDNFDFLDRLRGFGFVCEQKDGQGNTFFVPSKEPQSPGFRTGELLVILMRDHGIHTPDGLVVIGHNFILGARESLEFCAALQRPGSTKDALKLRYLNHLVFNNKLNSFKFDNLFKFLVEIGLIEEVDGLIRIGHSPAPLTFYCMVERYLLEADYEVGIRVNTADQVCYLDRLLPPVGSKRDMRFESLRLSKFPFEGWRGYDSWLTSSGFRELLNIGLIHPLSVAKVLSKLASNPNCESGDAAQRGMTRIREKFVKDTITKPVWELPLEGLEEWSRVLGVSKADNQQSLF
jgi:hypothetical protein